MAASSTRFLNVTSSNTVVLLRCPELIPTSVRLENFAADNACAMDEFTFAEHSMGVDGCLTIGITPVAKTLTLNFQPTAPCIKHLQNITLASMANEYPYEIELQITIPSDHKEYMFYNGGLISDNIMPGVKKTLDQTAWKFAFADLDIRSI